MKVRYLLNKTTIYLTVLATIVLLILWPVLSNQFLLEWDDAWVPMNYYTETGFTWSNSWDVLSHFFHGQYSPINEFYYMFLYLMGGNSYNPVLFHAAGLFLHLVNVFLVYFFIDKILKMEGSIRGTTLKVLGFFTALLVGIHPFMVEAVAWISASKIVLYVLLFLSGLLCYLNYVESHRSKYWYLTLLFFILSFGAKEQAVVMPLVLLLIDWVLKRNVRDKKIWLEKLPFIVLALLFSVVTVCSQGPVENSNTPTYPVYQRLVYACYSLTEYFTKLLVPVKLSYLYPFPNLVGEALPVKFWVYPVLVASSLILSWGFLKKNKWITWGLGWFVVGLLPALHLIPINRYAIVADRYSYLSSIGFFFVLTYLVYRLLAWRPDCLKAVVLAVGLYLISIGSYAHIRSKVWHDSNSLKKELRKHLLQIHSSDLSASVSHKK